SRPSCTSSSTPTAAPIPPACASPAASAPSEPPPSNSSPSPASKCSRKKTPSKSTFRKSPNTSPWSSPYDVAQTVIPALFAASPPPSKKEHHMPCHLTRRHFITGATAALASAGLAARAADTATAPVAIARVKTYDPAELVPSMQRMFDQLGGLERIVRNKTV